MESGFLSVVNSVIQAIDPGHAILALVQPALNIFRSETFAPDMALAMTLSAVALALYFRFCRVGPACDALRIRTNFLKKCTNNRIFSDNFYEFDLLMKEGVFLEPGWNEFVETCLLRDPRLKSDIEITVRPADFINIHDAEHSGLDIKWFHSLSAVYVGVGLLFTFAGLVAALYFSSAAINAVISTAAAPDGGSHDADVQRALAQLLNTATFKFLTSIAGLGCSIVLAYLDGRWRAKIQHGFDELCRELERCTVMVTPESIAERQYRMLGDIADLLKKMASAKPAQPHPAPLAAAPAEAVAESLGGPVVEPPAGSGPPLQAVVEDALARIETMVVSASHDLAAGFEQSLARLVPRPAAERAEPVVPPPPSPPSPPQLTGEGLAAVLDRSLGAAFASGSRSLAGSLENTLTSVLVPAITHALGPIRQALVFAGTPPVAVPPSPPGGGLLEAAARIETAVAAAAADFRAMVAETQGFKADLAASLSELSATLRADGDRNAALLRDGLAERAPREASPVPAETTSAPAPADPALEGLQQILARLNTGIERLTGGFDQVESKLAAHLAAFEGITRSTREAEQAIAGSARALQTASLPLSRVGNDLSVSVAGIAAAVEGSVSAMLQSQEAGQRLGDDLRTLCGQLQEVWGRHEARFIGVDESVARILTSIIQHTEAHGDALRTQVVAIDTHLAHAVNSLAANLEALHEITADLTAAAGKTDGAPPPAAVSPAAVSPAALSPAIAPPPPPVPVRAVADTMMFSPDRLRDI